MILPNSYAGCQRLLVPARRWVRNAKRRKQKQILVKGTSDLTSTWSLDHTSEAVFKDIYCHSWWSGMCEAVKTGWKGTKYVLSWINLKALAPEWVWDAQRFGIVDSLSERPQEPRSASIEWCCFPYNRKFFEFLETGLSMIRQFSLWRLLSCC